MFDSQQEAQSYAQQLTPKALVALLSKLDDAYYTKTASLTRDVYYDIIREVAVARQGESKTIVEYLKKVGFKPKRNFVDLPYRMPSLNKIKPGNGSVQKWAGDCTEFVLIDKEDAISTLLDYKSLNLPNLYTRGTDDEGQNINRIRTHLSIPNSLPYKKIGIRGETIMPEALFNELYADKFENARNMVIGLTGRLKGDISAAKNLHFLAYEIKGLSQKPSDQLALLKKLGFKVPDYKIVTSINDDMLVAYLAERRRLSPYEIDGIVIHKNIISKEAASGNPKNSISFKTNTAEDTVEATVLNVTWKVSKLGKINPQVNIKPVRLKGVTISNLTGHNAFFITHGYGYNERKAYVGKKDRPIGEGAILQIVRSGDVIPKIEYVLKPAQEPLMPDVPYRWDERGIAIRVADSSNNKKIRVKKLTHFFTTLKVEGLKEANIQVLVDNGFDSFIKIISMTLDDFLTLPRTKETKATKLHTNIKNAIATATIEQLADATGVFGAGMGTRRCKLIFDEYPDILQYKSTKATRLVMGIKGFDTKTCEPFVEGMPKFAAFLNKIKFVNKPKQMISKQCADWNVCFTGVRSAIAEEYITSNGGKIASGVTSNTTMLIVKSLSDSSSKIIKVQSLNVPILTLVQFLAQHVNGTTL